MAQQFRVQIIPVLANKARMPKEGELPPSIQFLARANAHELRSDQSFRDDVTHLIEKILAMAPEIAPHFDWQEALTRAKQGNIPSDWQVYRRRMSYPRRFGGFALFMSVMLFVFAGVVFAQGRAGYPTSGVGASMSGAAGASSSSPSC